MRLGLAIAGILLFIGLVVGLWASISSHATTKAELKQVVNKNLILEAQITELGKRINSAAEARKQGDQVRAEIRHESSKTEWGTHHVPPSVVDRLCKTATCATILDKVPASNYKPADQR